MIWSGQHAADGMASGFRMAGDTAGAAVVSKAIPGGSDIGTVGTGKNWWNKGGPDFFCVLFRFFMGLSWFKMVYMSSIFLGGFPKVLPTYTHRIFFMDKSPQADRVQKRSATALPMSGGR